MSEAVCQICLDDEPLGEIYQCSHGHLFCSSCWADPRRKKKVCPTCAVPLARRPIRNLHAERSLDARAPRPCVFGCGVALKRQDRATHVCPIASCPPKKESIKLCVHDGDLTRLVPLPTSNHWCAEGAKMRFYLQNASVPWLDVVLSDVTRTTFVLEHEGRTCAEVRLSPGEGLRELSLRATLEDGSTIRRHLDSGARVLRELDGHGSFEYAAGEGAPVLKRHRDPSGTEWLFEGDPPAKRCRITEGRPKEFFEGPAGEEALRRKEFCTGRTEFYDGDAGHEALRSMADINGTVSFFAGPRGEEALRRIEGTRAGSEGLASFYEGPKGQEALRCRIHATTGIKSFYGGAKDKEVLLRKEHADGTQTFYEESSDRVALRRIQRATGQLEFYEGEGGQEALRRKEDASGQKTFYVGSTGQERKVRTEFNGVTFFLEGDRGHEALRQVDMGSQTTVEDLDGVALPSGRATILRQFFEGSSGEEALRRSELSTGETQFFEGARGLEALRCVEAVRTGQKTFYYGSRGQEIKYRMEVGGKTTFFAGERGQEAKRRVEVIGVKMFFEGAKGEEEMRRREFPSGEKQFFEGATGAEALRRVELPSGETQVFEGRKGEERLVSS